MKLVGISEITATLRVETGLHIGAGDLEMRIGGVDNPVIKHPATDHPYVPGSSIKGKMRSLLEWRTGAIRDGKPLGLGQRQEPGVEPILKLFGIAGGEAAAEIGPTRLSVADAMLVAEPGRNEPLTEVKSENSINRVTGVALNPRQTERVASGTTFAFCATLRRFEDDADLLGLLLEGLRLIELDALGGSGSRGYGKVRFLDVMVDGEPRSLPVDPFARAA